MAYLKRDTFSLDFFKKEKILIFFLLIIALLVYFPSLNGRLFFDDEYFIIRNTYVHNFDLGSIFSSQAYAGAGQAGSFYRPLQFVFYALLYSFFKTNPIPYHLLSVLFHFGSASLLFFLLRDFKISKAISFFSALLFVVHPINTQAVSYVSGLGEPLGLFFLLLALLIYRKKEFFRNNFLVYLLFSICILFSLFAKERSIIFLFLFLLMNFTFPKEGKNFKELLKSDFVFLLVSTLIILFYLFLILTSTPSLDFGFFSTSQEYSANIFTRFFTFLHSFFEYVYLIFFPINLYSERAFEAFTSFFNIKIILSFLLLLLLAVLSLFKFKHKNVFLFSFFWFIIALLPSAGIIPLSYTIKEHWVYYSMIGFCFGFTYLFFNFVKNKTFAISFFLLICLMLSIVAVARNAEWANPESFFKNELENNPVSENALANLAYEYYLKNDIDNAIILYQRGIAVTETNQLAMMHYNLGYMYSLKGEINKSIPLYMKSLEIDPNYIYALEQISKYYYEQKDFENFNKFYSRLLLIQKELNI